MRVLIVDIGNTRIKWAVFDAKGLLLVSDLFENTSIGDALFFDTIYKTSPDAVFYASVGNVDSQLIIWLGKHFKNCFELTHETKLPFVNQYTTPKTLGKDRLAGIAGAWHLFPAKNCLVIDAGTCIKLDFISKEGFYIGGSISPGIEMRFQALQRFTARLPLLEKKLDFFPFIGDSTETAMTSGVQWGAIAEIEGFIARYESLYGEVQLIITGGDAPFLRPHLKNTIFAAPNLVLIGLFSILNHIYITDNELHNKN